MANKIKFCQRKWLTLGQKLKIIEEHDSGKSTSAIARERHMNESSVRSILRKKAFYKSFVSFTALTKYKSLTRHRSLLLDKVEKTLIQWIEDNNQKRIQLTEAEIQKKALALFEELKPSTGCTEKFTASRGWFYRFKNRINLQNCIIPTEKPAPDRESAVKFRAEFAKIVEDGCYTQSQIFNVEEVSLYWKKLPSNSFPMEREGCQKGYKAYKDCLTLLLGSNAAGDLKLKPMIVYRSETPSALRDCEKDLLPVIWRSSKKAWLTKEIFEDWFTNYFCPTVEIYCANQGLEFKILLLLETTPSHEISGLNKNIKVVFLPKHTASLLQPMTLGIFPVLKAKYLREVFSQAVSYTTPETPFTDFWSNYNIKDGIDNIFKCWSDTSPEDLVASWYHLLPDIKPKDFELEVTSFVQDVVSMGQYLGSQTIDMQSVQNCIDINFQDLDSPMTEIEEVICKEEPFNVYEDEDQDSDHELNNQELSAHELNTQELSTDEVSTDELNTHELEKILQNVDVACETIALVDADVERSLKVRQILQNGIQPYRDLYIERNKKRQESMTINTLQEEQ